MSSQDSINSNTSKEEVGNYLFTKLDLKEEVKTNIIKEYISGDVLYDLDDKDFKELGLKVGPIKRLKLILQEIKGIFGEKQMNEKITKNANSQEVNDFFRNSLNFTGNLDNLDRKGLLEMSQEDINKLGLDLGQKKKIIRYINFFKTLKIEEPEEEIKITKESSKEEVTEFLKKNYNFQIKALKLWMSMTKAFFSRR